MADLEPNGTSNPPVDVEMKEEDTIAPPPALDSIPDQNLPPADTLSSNPQLIPTAVATPPAPSSMSAPRPDSMPPQPSTKPDQPVAHGGPTRQYLNQFVTPHLLEGMKHVAAYEPKKPLLWLSEFLRERSKEVEG